MATLDVLECRPEVAGGHDFRLLDDRRLPVGVGAERCFQQCLAGFPTDVDHERELITRHERPIRHHVGHGGGEPGVVVLVVGADEIRIQASADPQLPKRRLTAVMRGVGVQQKVQQLMPTDVSPDNVEAGFEDLPEAVREALRQGEDDVLFVGEELVDRSQRHTGPFGDAANCQFVEAVVDDDGRGSVQDALDAFTAALLPGRAAHVRRTGDGHF